MTVAVEPASAALEGRCTAVRDDERIEPCPPSTKPKAFIPLNIAVLTISDTRSLADDKSGTTLADRLTAAGHMLAAREIIVDDVDAIRIIIKRWIADPGVDAIITTGGTGFTGRDVTPEAIEPLFEKRMDGFSIAFHMLSHAKIGTSTIQSRATAGVAGATYHLLPAGIAGRLPRRLGRHSGRRSSITAPGPAISSRSCRGWTSICGARRRKARRSDCRMDGAKRCPHGCRCR